MVSRYGAAAADERARNTHRAWPSATSSELGLPEVQDRASAAMMAA